MFNYSAIIQYILCQAIFDPRPRPAVPEAPTLNPTLPQAPTVLILASHKTPAQAPDAGNGALSLTESPGDTLF